MGGGEAAAHPMRPADVLRRAAAYLHAHGVEGPLATAEALLMSILGTDRAGLYVRREGLDSGAARQFGRALCRRCAGTPLQHLTGEQRFLDLDLAVKPGVFVPRPETEGLVEAALDALDGSQAPLVIDVGTGTGAIALSIAARRPDATVMATDLSKAAVALARRNATRLGLDVTVWPGDLLTPVPVELHARLSLLVSNPPYVDRAAYDSLPLDVRADPYEALVGGTEFHRRLAEEAPVWLGPGGWLVLEIGDDQGDRVRDLVAAHLTEVEVLPDLAGRDRVVRGRRPA
jgi:release factor glutamine methyltransferase